MQHDSKSAWSRSNSSKVSVSNREPPATSCNAQTARAEADSGKKSLADLTRAAGDLRDKESGARREAKRLRSIANTAQGEIRRAATRLSPQRVIFGSSSVLRQCL
jgi:hypothetical protein